MSITTALKSVFKRVYTPAKSLEIAARDKPFLTMLKGNMKEILTADGTDPGFVVLLKTAQAGAVAGTVADAQTAAKRGQVERFLVTKATRYAVLDLQGEEIMFGSSSKNAANRLLDIKEREVEGVLENFGQSVSSEIWRGSGAGFNYLGVISAVNTSTNVITLTSISDTIRFQVGDVLDVSTSTTYATQRGLTLTVTAVDYTAGTVTYSGTDTDIAAGDYVYSKYLYGPDLTTEALGGNIAGVQDYVTSGTPAALWGLTRTSNPVGLSGWKGTWRGSISETIKYLCALMQGFIKGNISDRDIWMNPIDALNLSNELGVIGTVKDGDTSTFGAQFIVINTPMGNMRVLLDKYVPAGRGYILKRSTWALHHMGAFPHLIDDDGLQALRAATTDAVQYRWRLWTQLVCDAPFENGTFPCNATA